jgi:hypothetical protein
LLCLFNGSLVLAGGLLTVYIAPGARASRPMAQGGISQAQLTRGGLRGTHAEASSSGIPEVMGYLNGVHIPRIMRLRTLLVKLLGSLCANTCGLAVGVLGPLVHVGAIVGSGLTRGQKVRVRVELMGSQTCRIAGESQSVLIMINPIIFTRTRRCSAAPPPPSH